MDQESKSGRIMPSMRENGEKIKPTGEESSGMLTVTFTKVNGKMIRLTDMESTST